MKRNYKAELIKMEGRYDTLKMWLVIFSIAFVVGTFFFMVILNEIVYEIKEKDTDISELKTELQESEEQPPRTYKIDFGEITEVNAYCIDGYGNVLEFRESLGKFSGFETYERGKDKIIFREFNVDLLQDGWRDEIVYEPLCRGSIYLRMNITEIVDGKELDYQRTLIEKVETEIPFEVEFLLEEAIWNFIENIGE